MGGHEGVVRSVLWTEWVSAFACSAGRVVRSNTRGGVYKEGCLISGGEDGKINVWPSHRHDHDARGGDTTSTSTRRTATVAFPEAERHVVSLRSPFLRRCL